MRYFLVVVFLVLACASGGVADPSEEAKFAYRCGTYSQSVRLVPPSGEQGSDAFAQSNLGRFYYMGQAAPKDSRETVKEWRRAAAQGDEEAPLTLGLMYEKGRGAPQDNVLAYMWYTVAGAVLSGEDARVAKNLQDHVASRMTAAQIRTAQELARRCQETKFKECD